MSVSAEVSIGSALGDSLAVLGFNVLGALSRADYDSLVPTAWSSDALLPSTRSAVILGSGGAALFRALRAAPEFSEPDPVDRFTERVAEDVAADWRRLGFETRASYAFERRDGSYADFVALGRAAGLGAPSRLGLLLHRVYGPWFALRALLLTERALAPTGPGPAFTPCDGCPAPCAGACRGAALAGPQFDAGSCWETRLRDSECRERCDARRACVIGPEHAYDAGAEAHHMGAAYLRGDWPEV